MRAVVCTLIISILAVGCISSHPETSTSQGIAEIRVDAASFQAFNITHVTVESAGISQDLVLNQATGTFDGTLILPSGPQSLVARAFSGETLVGLSHPTPVEVTAGIVTRIVVRILDVTDQAAPVFGPIFDSLTYPTTTQAEDSASFAISVVAPVGDPVSYDWTSDCQDSTFATPHAATTTWSKPSQGACTINVIATSNGFSVAQSFAIVVFPAGSGSGAVDAGGVFITAPFIFVVISNCFPASTPNASCSGAVSSPDAPPYQLDVTSWGGSTPGTLEVSDNCGGRFGTSSQAVGFVTGNWLPPVGGGVCIIKARAVNGDGLATTVSAAVLVHAGTPGTTQPPQIFATYNTGCSLANPAAECGAFPAGGQIAMSGSVSYADGFPGSLTIIDDCGGSQPTPGSAAFFGNVWTLPGTPGATCTTTVRATSLEGVTSEVSAHYHLQ